MHALHSVGSRCIFMNSKKQKPRIKDIAELAGVSSSTVSRALSKSPLIPESTRVKIEQIATKLGYEMNPYVGAYMSHVRAGKQVDYHATVLFIDFTSNPDDWDRSNVVYGMFLGAKRQAKALGYRLERLNIQPKTQDVTRLIKSLKNRNIAGILFSPSTRFFYDSGSVDPFLVFPCVTLGLKVRDRRMAFAMNDQYHSSQLAHLKLLELGYKRIGLVVVDFIESALDYRFTHGFESVRSLVGEVDLIPPFMVSTGHRFTKKFAEWFERHQPDVILSVELDVPFWLEDRLGKRIPEDVAYAHFEAVKGDNQIAGICQNNEQLGESAMNLLYGAMARNEEGEGGYDSGVLVRSVWVDGQSAPPVID